MKLQAESKFPSKYVEDFTRIVSLLETADKELGEFARESDIDKFLVPATPSGHLQEDTEKLKELFKLDKGNVNFVIKIAGMLKKQRKGDEAQAMLKDFILAGSFEKVPDLKAAAVLKMLGIMMCRAAKSLTGSDFAEGQKYINMAIAKNPKDSDAYASLAGTYKRLGNHDFAHDLYRRALDVDPDDPYPLGNFLIYEIIRFGYKQTMDKYRNHVDRAIASRSQQAEIPIDVPWVFFDLGTFYLLKGEIHQSLLNYLLAIKYSWDSLEIMSTVDTITRLERDAEQIKGLDFACMLLMLGAAFHPKMQDTEDVDARKAIIKRLDAKMQQEHRYDREKITIIAGSTSKQEPVVYQVMHDRFTSAFSDFRGTIISGGIRAGVCEVVGDLKDKNPDRIKAIGYHPANIPASTACDARYKLIQTRGNEFSILEPLQYWYDLLKSGISPADVKLIGYNGGPISALEFRLAIIFGAQVCIVGDSGRAATDLAQNPGRWIEILDGDEKARRRAFKIIKNNADEIRNFLTRPFVTDPSIENLYRVSIHRVKGGSCMYEFNFAKFDVDPDIFAGYLSALDNLGEDFKLGNIYGIRYRKGFLSGGYFSDLAVKVIFLLHDPPSIHLERRMSEFIQAVERELGPKLRILANTGQPYKHGPEIEKIYEAVFGKEIKKFF
jgi:tetratricopeptide (TPR) repeat protein